MYEVGSALTVLVKTIKIMPLVIGQSKSNINDQEVHVLDKFVEQLIQIYIYIHLLNQTTASFSSNVKF